MRKIRIISLLLAALMTLSVFSALSPAANAAGNAEDEAAVNAALSYLRDEMKKHSPKITGSIVLTSLHPGDALEMIIERLFEHTGDPKEGDYLAHSYDSISYGCSYLSADFYKVNYHFDVEYRTTLEEENEVDDRVADLLWSFDLGGKNDYEKVKIIYDYIADNVEYDMEHYGDGTYLRQFTAYAALADGKAVCEGYSTLFYRLALECGIDARIISGYAGGGAHAWNIVKLGDKYYNLDVTFASSSGNKSGYFLRGDVNFKDHVRNSDFDNDDFNEAYPISYYDFSPSSLMETAAPTEQAATEPTEEATEEPTEAVTEEPTEESTEESTLETEQTEAPTDSEPSETDSEPVETRGFTEYAELPTESGTATEETEPGIIGAVGNIGWTYYPTTATLELRRATPEDTASGVTSWEEYNYEIRTIKIVQGFRGFRKIDLSEFPNASMLIIPESYRVLGDVNLDGRVTISDATTINYHICCLDILTPTQLKNADVNLDGNVDISDVTAIQKFLAGLLPEITIMIGKLIK